MKYIIYISTASIYFKPETLETMLVKFRKNNEANHITGMMLFSEGTFLQVLEGNDVDIDTLIKKIEADRRHHSIIKLGSGKIEERIFPNWSMGFKVATAEEFKDLKGYIDPSSPDFFPATQSGDVHPAIAILKTFAENNRMR